MTSKHNFGGLASHDERHLKGRVRKTDAGDRLDTLLREISAETASLSLKLAAAVDLLAERGEWSAIVRLLVGAGGYQLAEIAKVTGVMRSTATRWYHAETTPLPEQAPVYLGRLRKHLLKTVPLDLKVNVETLVAR